VLWETLSRVFDISPISAPGKIFESWLAWGSQNYLRDLIYSLSRLYIGLLIGIFGGLGLAILTSSHGIIDRLLTPILDSIRYVPPVAMIPFIITFLGIGEISKIFSVAISSTLILWVAIHSGLKTSAKRYELLALSLNLSPIIRWRYLTLPSLYQAIFPALRVSLGFGVVMIYVSELSGASYGIGYRLSNAYLGYDMPMMFAAFINLTLIGFITDSLLVSGFKQICPWSFAKNDKRLQQIN